MRNDNRQQLERTALDALEQRFLSIVGGTAATVSFLNATSQFSGGDFVLEAKLRGRAREVWCSVFEGWRNPMTLSLVSRLAHGDFRRAIAVQKMKMAHQALCAAAVSGAREDRWHLLLAYNPEVRRLAIQNVEAPIPSAFLAGVLLRQLGTLNPTMCQETRRVLPGLMAATAPEVVAGGLVYALPEMLLAAEKQQRSEALSRGRGSFRRSGSWQTGADFWQPLLDRPGVLEAICDHLLQIQTGPGARLLSALLRLEKGDHLLRDLARGGAQPSVRAMAVLVLVGGIFRWHSGFAEAPPVALRRVYSVRQAILVRSVLQKRAIAVPLATLSEMEVFVRDPSPRVRRALLDGLDSRAASLQRAIAPLLMDDPSPSIRQRATFLLRD